MFETLRLFFLALGLSSSQKEQKESSKKRKATSSSNKKTLKPKSRNLEKLQPQISAFQEQLETMIPDGMSQFIFLTILSLLDLKPNENDEEQEAMDKLKKLQQWKNAKVAEFRLNQSLSQSQEAQGN